MALAHDLWCLAGVNVGSAAPAYAWNQAVPLGDVVIAALCFPSTSHPTITSVTDDTAVPNTWTVLIQPFAAGGGTGQSAALIMGVIDNTAITTSNHITFHLSGSAQTYVIADAFKGFVGTPTVDVLSHQGGVGSTPSSPSGTTTVADEIAFAHVGTDNSSTGFTAGSGWTISANQGYDSSNLGRSEYQILSATGAQTGPMTLDRAVDWTAMLVTVYDLVAASGDHGLTVAGFGH